MPGPGRVPFDPMGPRDGAGEPGSAAGPMDAAAQAARELLAGLATQIDDLAGFLAPDAAGAGLADSLGGELGGELSALFAEVGEILARLIATLIAILEAVVKVLRSDPADSPSTPESAYQEITVAIRRGQA